MKKHLTFKDEKSDKFWSIEVNGKLFTVIYGKTGTAGQASTKDFDDDTTCMKEAEKLVKEKRAKGYSESGNFSPMETAPKPKSKKGINVKDIEDEVGSPLPERLKKFYESGEYHQYEGMYIYGLPNYSADSKFKVKFFTKDFTDLLDENEIEMPNDEGAHYIQFIPIGDVAEFIGVDISKEGNCAVAMWEHEDGLFHIHSASLDEFLAKLLKKGEKTPFEKLDKAIDKARALEEKDKYKEACAILNEAVIGMSLEIPKEYNASKKMGRFFNLRGICNKNLDNIEEATNDYNSAFACGDYYSGLNLVSLYLKNSEYTKALDFITVLEDKYLDSYCRYHVKNYKGKTYILQGKAVDAEKIYKTIFDEYAVSDEEQVLKSVKSLKEIEAEKPAHFEIATNILKWFGPKQYELSEAQIKDNRLWWNSLPAFGMFWQNNLKKSIKLNADHASDNDIARLLETTDLSFDEDEVITNLKPFEKLQNLKDVSFYGDVDSLEIFKGMKTLKTLTYNGDVNKTFKVPSKLNARFIESAKVGNLKEVKEYLAQGVDINVKVDHNSALSQAVLARHYDLAIYLIQQGANVYDRFGYNNDNELKTYCGEDNWKMFVDAFEKRGGVKKESVFSILEKKIEKNSAQLNYLRNVKEEYELTDGLSRKDNFPEDAYFEMRKDYPGYKKDIELVDCFLTGGLFVGNTKVKNYFLVNKISNVEILPVKVKDHNMEFVEDQYFIINPLSCNCLDVEKSEPTYNHIDPESISNVQNLVIDESRLPENISVFRIENYSNKIIFRKELAHKIIREGFTGIFFDDVSAS